MSKNNKLKRIIPDEIKIADFFQEKVILLISLS